VTQLKNGVNPGNEGLTEKKKRAKDENSSLPA